MNTNMEYRQYLMNNATSIIKNNQIVSTSNCPNKYNTQHNTISSPPILFNCTNEDPPQFDNSDLKQKFLKWYRSISNRFTPGIIYQQ